MTTREAGRGALTAGQTVVTTVGHPVRTRARRGWWVGGSVGSVNWTEKEREKEIERERWRHR